MKIGMKILTLGLVLALAAPDVALARAGGGRSSYGSRGMRTYQSPPMARPIQRSTTPRTGTQANPQPSPSVAPQTPFTQPGGSFFGRHPFLSSLAGGFLGAGLFGMLFGHGAFGAGTSTAGVGLGGLLQILFLGALAVMAFRWIRGRGGLAGMGMRGNGSAAGAMPSLPMPSEAAAQIALTPEDKRAFKNTLIEIQLSWGEEDLARLQQYVTPEMMGYFKEELAANQSRGLINRVTDVVVLASDVVESWAEGSLDYATMHMKWRAVDFMARRGKQPFDPDYVAEGDAQTPAEPEEVWTFVRAREGGQWLLSAIQQVV